MLDIESVQDVALLTSAQQLQEAARDYNWDDGFDIPSAIAHHPQCDLGVALELFWLSEAITVYLGEAKPHAYNKKWLEFCRAITQRILSGHYHPGAGVFQSELSSVQEFKLRRRGVPELLITGRPNAQLDIQPDGPAAVGSAS